MSEQHANDAEPRQKEAAPEPPALDEPADQAESSADQAEPEQPALIAPAESPAEPQQQPALQMEEKEKPMRFNDFLSSIQKDPGVGKQIFRSVKSEPAPSQGISAKMERTPLNYDPQLYPQIAPQKTRTIFKPQHQAVQYQQQQRHQAFQPQQRQKQVFVKPDHHPLKCFYCYDGCGVFWSILYDRRWYKKRPGFYCIHNCKGLGKKTERLVSTEQRKVRSNGRCGRQHRGKPCVELISDERVRREGWTLPSILPMQQQPQLRMPLPTSVAASMQHFQNMQQQQGYGQQQHAQHLQHQQAYGHQPQQAYGQQPQQPYGQQVKYEAEAHSFSRY